MKGSLSLLKQKLQCSQYAVDCFWNLECSPAKLPP